jgi:hypothetical protein
MATKKKSGPPRLAVKLHRRFEDADGRALRINEHGDGSHFRHIEQLGHDFADALPVTCFGNQYRAARRLARCDHATHGRLTVTVVPLSGSLWMVNAPPCNSASRLLMIKPSPRPCYS